jgi:NitT/TauT family transport system permease protein
MSSLDQLPPQSFITGVASVRPWPVNPLLLAAGVSWLAATAAALAWPDVSDWIRTDLYAAIVGAVGVLVLAAALVGRFTGLRAPRLERSAPWLIVIGLVLVLWELASAKFRWLPLPFFPPPQELLEVYTDDLPKLAASVFASAQLLVTGFAIGAVLGFITGVCVGWSRRAGYWVHPLLRFIGPLPATAWLPIAFFAFPSSWSASIFLIALAAGFPVTVLTWSGIASVPSAYYDVARTLGARPWFLVLHIAIPSALSHVFVGLFMALAAAFSMLMVAELLGVKAGIGFYLQWAQGWASYGNVYAALIVLALACSGAITLLFLVRDRLLSWQKGLVKW